MQQSFGPPATVLEMGTFMHSCEGEMVCESINPKIPYFNAPIYLENKVQLQHCFHAGKRDANWRSGIDTSWKS